MLKKFVAVAAVMLGLAVAAPASAQDGIADPILFDINGLGDNFTPIISLDWNDGNAIAEATALSPEGTTFQLYYQANLSSANIFGGGTIANNTAGGDDSIMVTLGFQETLLDANYVAAANQLTLTFGFVSGGDNFFSIFADDVPGDNLTGVCFVCGTEIMSGSLTGTGFVSTFTISNIACTTDASGNITSCTPTSAPVPLDSTNPNSYPTVFTVSGAGTVKINGIVDTYDTNYFQGIAGATIDFTLSDSSTTLPYQQTDPSACFFATSQTGTLINPTCDGTGSNLPYGPFEGVSTVGTLNGISGPNTMFEVDGTTSFDVTPAVIPEPATLTLLGVGLLGTAAARRRAKKAAKK